MKDSFTAQRGTGDRLRSFVRYSLCLCRSDNWKGFRLEDNPSPVCAHLAAVFATAFHDYVVSVTSAIVLRCE